jgi:hypothetical protein
MIIRSVEPKDLPRLSRLSKNKSIKNMVDICSKYSKLCLDDNDKIVCYILLRESSVLDYFNGNIPKQENLDDDAEEGEEWWVKEDIEQYNDKHYEVVAAFMKEDLNYNTESEFLDNVEYGDKKNYHLLYQQQIGVLWSRKELPFRHFSNFNDTVWINIPIYEW